ncbi:hypothetical protein HUB94_11375 [Paenibacillus cellulosilyticus]|nr:hypothetical protein HUB94_11375 [Paenibacillus cellulosilyticus]
MLKDEERLKIKGHFERPKNGVIAFRRRQDRRITPYSRFEPSGPRSGRGISGKWKQPDNPALAKSVGPGAFAP